MLSAETIEGIRVEEIHHIGEIVADVAVRVYWTQNVIADLRILPPATAAI